MCRDNNMSLVVFDMNKPGNLARLIDGEAIGTLVT
jgi:uridylate kinase